MARNDPRSTSGRESTRGATQDRATGTARERTGDRGNVTPAQQTDVDARRRSDAASGRRRQSDVASGQARHSDVAAGQDEQPVDFWPGEYWTPQIEIFQRGDELVVRADLPGLKPDEVTVEVTDDTLAIHGERRRECEESGAGYYRSERSYGSFHRRIGLPHGVDAERITAQFKDGVLEVTMPAAAANEGTRGRRIAVKGG